MGNTCQILVAIFASTVQWQNLYETVHYTKQKAVAKRWFYFVCQISLFLFRMLHTLTLWSEFYAYLTAKANTHNDLKYLS